MSYAFYICTGLSGTLNADILSNKPELTDISYMFRGINNLSSNIPAKFLASSTKLKNIGYAFRNTGITGFEFIDEPNGKTFFLKTAADSITNMQATFYNCKLNTDIPEYWTTPFNVAEHNGCFYLCGRDSDIDGDDNWIAQIQ